MRRKYYPYEKQMKSIDSHQPIFTIEKNKPYPEFCILRDGHFLQYRKSIEQAEFARLLWRVAFAEHYLGFKVSDTFQKRLIQMGMDITEKETKEKEK